MLTDGTEPLRQQNERRQCNDAISFEADQILSLAHDFEDFSLLEERFSLKFIIDCTVNPNRGKAAKFIGALLRDHEGSSSIFINQILYHERVEFLELSKLGYSDQRLSERAHPDDYCKAHYAAKICELRFLKHMCGQMLQVESSSLSLTFATLSVMPDYGMQIPPYSQMWEDFNAVPPPDKEKIEIAQVQTAIAMYKLGEDKCSGESAALDYAKKFAMNDPGTSNKRDMLDIIFRSGI